MTTVERLSAAMLVFLLSASRAPADPPNPPPVNDREITVTGDAFVRTPPDRAEITFVVDGAAATAGEAEQSLDKKFSSVQDTVKKFGGDGAIVRLRGKKFSAANSRTGAIVPQSQVRIELTAAAEIHDLARVGQVVDAI